MDLYKNLKNFAVVACVSNSKIPATKHGLNDARFNVDVEGLIKKGYNIAVGCAKSGVIAFDLDYHNPDSKAAEELLALQEELNCPLPDTLTQSSATGNGYHLIFSDKGIIEPKGKLTKNVDIRYNAYIMFAPSIINGRRYEIINGINNNGNFVIAELPEPWVNYINKGLYNRQAKYKNECFSAPPKKYKNININAMFKNCAFLAHCRDNAVTLSEPEWFSMVSVLATIEDSDELIHELSQPYEKYSFLETQKKIDNARKFGRGHSCTFISGCFPHICCKCQFMKGGK